MIYYTILRHMCQGSIYCIQNINTYGRRPKLIRLFPLPPNSIIKETRRQLELLITINIPQNLNIVEEALGVILNCKNNYLFLLLYLSFDIQ